jgi:DtxR family transcriptional regulator, iron-dependent repressor
VSETVNRLVEQGYAQLLENRSLRLTPKGRALAVSIVRRHRLAERLLTDVIGLEWEKVHREADRWEHAISADVEEKLVQLLGDPATCPHGNPIPGSAHKVDVRGSTPLSRVDSGPVTVSRISERSSSTTTRWCCSRARSSSRARTRSSSDRRPTASS